MRSKGSFCIPTVDQRRLDEKKQEIEKEGFTPNPTKDLWNGINKELHQRMEEHRDLQKLVRKSSGKSKLQSKEIATKREIEQASGNIVRLESQKRSGYEQYVLGKISKEKFLKLKQDAENEIEAFRQTKAENQKESFIDRIEVFNDERVKIRFTFEDVLAGYAE